MNVEWIGQRQRRREEWVPCTARTLDNKPCKCRATWKVDGVPYCAAHKNKKLRNQLP